MKRNIRNIHQWLGLFSGLLVFVIAITGAIYTFQEEILNLTESHRFVPIKNLPLLKPSQLETIAKAKLPGKTLHSIEYKERG
nr:PepSY domain-containing protein [Saprospiraceae bacterium]